MTIQQEDVIRMAQESGIDAYPDHLSSYDSESVKISVLTRFVELVAAHELTARQAAQAENADLKERLARSGVEIRKAVRDEREECAKVCDAMAQGWEKNPGINPKAGYVASANCASSIRARGK